MFNIRQLRLFTCISRIFKISITKNNIIISGCWFPSLLKICVCKRIRHDGIFYTNVYCTYILNLFVLLKYMLKAFSKLVLSIVRQEFSKHRFEVLRMQSVSFNKKCT